MSPQQASPDTSAANADVGNELPLDDRADFDAANRGLVAREEGLVIRDTAGNAVWDTTTWAFLDTAEADEVNPSLLRQSRLAAIHGLFKVTDRIHQVRGYDLSVMTVVEGDTGYIVIDPLISAEPAAAALALARANLGDRPVVAVIYTHSHIDHYGGIHGVVTEEQLAAGEVRIIGPADFLHHAVSENVMAGNAMARRGSYMYGNLLPRATDGNVGAGLGQTTSAGSVGLVPPLETVDATGTRLVVDGVEIVFQDTPGAEAPSEFCFYFPQFKALCMSEIATHTLHNCYTLRGAEVRNALKWSKYLQEASVLFGDAEVLFASHHWPTWGNEAVHAFLASQRDLYRYIHDETLRLANHGYVMDEIAEMVELPDAIGHRFANRGYYGSVNHDVKAQYQLYLGWFDGNPAHLHPLPPADAAVRWVEYMGGAEAVLERARRDFEAGEYRWVAEVVNKVVFADPANREARELQADTLEQLGFQSESGPWRNFYLSGAQELRTGVFDLPSPRAATPDTLRGMTLEMIFDYLSIRLNGPAAAGLHLRFNLEFPDVGKRYLLEASNGVLVHFEDRHDDDADASLVLDRATLDRVLLGAATLEDLVTSGDITVTGDAGALPQLLSMLDEFDFWFPIVTPRP